MKECKIYYATVIETEGRWAKKGEKVVEPVRVEGQAPLGKAPELCCGDIKKAIEAWGLFIGSEHLSIVERNVPTKINFCPFCGAKIVYISNLKVNAVKYTRPCDAYYFEEV